MATNYFHERPAASFGGKMPNLRIGIFGQIEPNLIQNISLPLRNAKTALANTPDPNFKVEVIVNSWGGDIGTAFAAYNFLRASGLPVAAYNVGECTSAANVVFLAGDERYAAEFSFFKFHGMTWDFGATGAHGAARIEDVNSTIQALQGLQAKLYASRTKMSGPEIANQFLKTACFTPADAQQRGIIHAVKEPPFE